MSNQREKITFQRQTVKKLSSSGGSIKSPREFTAMATADPHEVWSLNSHYVEWREKPLSLF